VASIAFGRVVPAVDGNVRRVLARVFDEETPGPGWLRERADALVDPDRPGDWNQALMDLGATVCTPRAPRCEGCPVAQWCAAKARGTQESRPTPHARTTPRKALFALAVLHRRGRLMVRRRPEGGLLGGMWAFPEVEVGAPAEAQAAASRLVLALGWSPAHVAETLPACGHRFTHLHATYHPYLVDVTDATSRDPSSAGGEVDDVTWLDPADPRGVALPVSQRRVLESAHSHLGGGVA
jgi:A/G-specific adenine glycosylase